MILEVMDGFILEQALNAFNNIINKENNIDNDDTANKCYNKP